MILKNISSKFIENGCVDIFVVVLVLMCDMDCVESCWFGDGDIRLSEVDVVGISLVDMCDMACIDASCFVLM